MSTIPSTTPEPSHHACLFSPFDLARLDVLAPGPRREGDLSEPNVPVDWDEVHFLIQRIFGRMAARIRDRWPMIESRGGKASARSFYLFSYMTFSLVGDDETLEAVIAGLHFDPTPSTDNVRVNGDIGGEESGRVDFELGERTVRLALTEVIPLALDMAIRLAERGELIAQRVLERQPAPQY